MGSPCLCWGMEVTDCHQAPSSCATLALASIMTGTKPSPVIYDGQQNVSHCVWQDKERGGWSMRVKGGA